MKLSANDFFSQRRVATRMALFLSRIALPGSRYTNSWNSKQYILTPTPKPVAPNPHHTPNHTPEILRRCGRFRRASGCSIRSNFSTLPKTPSRSSALRSVRFVPRRHLKEDLMIPFTQDQPHIKAKGMPLISRRDVQDMPLLSRPQIFLTLSHTVPTGQYLGRIREHSPRALR